jgi:hypothetical protein
MAGEVNNDTPRVQPVMSGNSHLLFRSGMGSRFLERLGKLLNMIDNSPAPIREIADAQRETTLLCPRLYWLWR